MLLAAGRYLAPIIDKQGDTLELAMCYTSVTLVTGWALLGQRRFAAGALGSILVAGGAGWAAEHMVGGGRPPIFWPISTVLQSLFLIASLWVVRAAGYRVIRQSVAVDES